MFIPPKSIRLKLLGELVEIFELAEVDRLVKVWDCCWFDPPVFWFPPIKFCWTCWLLNPPLEGVELLFACQLQNFLDCCNFGNKFLLDGSVMKEMASVGLIRMSWSRSNWIIQFPSNKSPFMLPVKFETNTQLLLPEMLSKFPIMTFLLPLTALAAPNKTLLYWQRAWLSWER